MQGANACCCGSLHLLPGEAQQPLGCAACGLPESAGSLSAAARSLLTGE